MSPGTFSDRSQLTSAPSVASGERLGDFLATVELEKAFPPVSDFRRSVRAGFSPTEIFPPSKEGG